MKHSILFTSLGLCLFSFACGSAENSSTDDGAGGGTSGPQWLSPVEVGDAGAGATDPALASEEAAVTSIGEELTLSGWRLQLPDNSQTTAVNSDHKPWYYSNGSARVFADPSFGITTSGSKHCRTEMREIATFKASGTNTITVTGKITKGSSGITIGQVFNDDDSIPLAELEYTGGDFGVLYEEKKGGGKMYPLNGSVKIGQQYSYTLSLTKGVLKVTTSTGGSFTKTPSSAVSGNKFYFKVGNYDQGSTSSKTSVSSTIRSIVEVSKIAVSHK